LGFVVSMEPRRKGDRTKCFSSDLGVQVIFDITPKELFSKVLTGLDDLSNSAILYKN